MAGLLEGVKVVELGGYGAAPFCTMMLGDLGAEVVKVESPTGDPYRENPPFVKDESLYFMSINRNKRSVCLDLKTPEDYQSFLTLLRGTDVVVHNLRPDVDRALKVDYASLCAQNPAIVYCSISGYGDSGPLRKEGAYDLIIQAYTGLMLLGGEESDPPLKVAPAVPDIAGAMCAAFAIVSCLFKRMSTGTGDYVEMSLFDATLYSLALAYLPYYLGTGSSPGRWGSGHSLLVPMQAFKGADSRYFVTGVTSEVMWTRFCAAIDHPELAGSYPSKEARIEFREQLVGKLTEIFIAQPAEFWVKRLSEHGVPSAPVLNLAEALMHPQTRARGMLQTVDHPTTGSVTMIGTPFKLSKNPGSIRLPPPTLGQDKQYIPGEKEKKRF
ncbi:MAG: CoA transferase [Deltaproteobacteria bacterium]|nr:CoA transferase [Deltaproteobacteria bacterium]